MMELLSHGKASSPDPLHQEVIFKRPSAYSKMETLIKEMQDAETGVPVRSQKLFLTSIPAAFAGYDIIEWLMERLNIEDSVEAIHIANLLCQHGYFFPVGDNRNLSVKDDSSLYRFQTPYYWPSQVPCLDNVDYAIYLSKRTMRNKQKHGLEDYEMEALGSLRKNLAQKWDFVTMQADEQVRISKERKKVDKMVSDSQERAFWRVLKPPPGATSYIETPPMFTNDFHSHEGMKQKGRTNMIEELRAEVALLRISCLRSRIKVSQALESLATHCEVYHEHDAFLVTRQPSNPWVTEDTYFWVINAPLVEIPVDRRVKRWGISLEDLIYDDTGLREFTAYLKKEYCHENIRFWLAVRDLRTGPASQIKKKASEIYNEFLSPGAPCEINIDMRTMEAVQKEMNYTTPSRFVFDPAADHVYAMLLKKDCYPRYIRSDHYKTFLANALQISQKKRFFSFAAPTKKKSSGTNPVIFPVAMQSATAGVGEVVKATDEVMLITTGAKPGDFLTASTADSLHDAEALSKLPDTPYRSQSFDDVCPWETSTVLPDKSAMHSLMEAKPSCSKSLLESGKAGSIPANLSNTITSSPQNLPCTSSSVTRAGAPLSSSYSSSSTNEPVPCTSSSVTRRESSGKPPEQPSTSAAATAAVSEPSTSSHQPLIIPPAKPSTSAAAAAAITKQDSTASTGSVSSSKKVDSMTAVSMRRSQDSQQSLAQSIASSASGAVPAPGGSKAPVRQQSSASAHSVKSDKTRSEELKPESTTIEIPTSSEPSNTSASVVSQNTTNNNITQQQQEQQQPSLLLTEPELKKDVDKAICPWDHENGSQAETTTFVKTYSTLGYL